MPIEEIKRSNKAKKYLTFPVSLSTKPRHQKSEDRNQNGSWLKGEGARQLWSVLVTWVTRPCQNPLDDCGTGCPALRTSATQPYCTLTNGGGGQFHVSVFYHN